MKTIKEKELRLALVCYGGISLAIYQHGISKEILKLVRASKAYHQGIDQEEKLQPDRTFTSVEGESPEYSTEEVYFDLLKKIGGENLDLRIIVDVIAGSSAGGINGVVLARALAHDLPIEPLTEMWIAEADIARVLAAEARAEFWNKWYIRPFVSPVIWLLSRKHLLPSLPDQEAKRKLSLFVRSRWFRPPLDGPRFSNLLLDALGAMGEPRNSTASLLPTGHKLDLLVTVTDFFGTERTIYIHTPPIVREREHCHILRFNFEHFKGGAVRSDFDLYNVPSLAFAARATASFPGAFPPVQIDEMDSVLATRKQSWPAREQFLRSNFRHYLEFSMNPENAVLVDGSVLNNKPIFEAIAAASAHPAFGEVDRRLVYIDPHPGEMKAPDPDIMPGFMQTIRGALSDLPRYEPIFSELSRIEVINQNIRRLKDAINTTSPHVEALVEDIVGDGFEHPADAARIRSWRLQVAHRVSTDTALIYNNYMQMMIDSSLNYLAELICVICAYPQGAPRAHWVADALHAWARHVGIYRQDYEIPENLSDDADLPPFAKLVTTFNLMFRNRRIQYVMRTINHIYNLISDKYEIDNNKTSLDAIKTRLYRQLNALQEYRGTEFLREQTVSHARNIFSRTESVQQADAIPESDKFSYMNRYEISSIVEQIGLECDFARFTHETDETLGSLEAQAIEPPFRRELLISYLGFDVWDAVTFPMISMHDPHEAAHLNELHEIVVDRISPDDVTVFERRGPVLKGEGFGGFAGFFSHAARENDYLWGRLHAVDRLFDIVASSVARDFANEIDMLPFKKRAFEIVLREEASRLPNVADLIADLQSTVTKL